MVTEAELAEFFGSLGELTLLAATLDDEGRDTLDDDVDGRNDSVREDGGSSA